MTYFGSSVSITEVMICWNPKPDSEVRLIPWPDTHDLAHDFACATGACWAFVHGLNDMKRRVLVQREALRLILDYGLAPAAVDKALTPIREYREALAEMRKSKLDR